MVFSVNFLSREWKDLYPFSVYVHGYRAVLPPLPDQAGCTIMNSMEKALEILLHDLKQKVETVLEDVEAEFILYGSRARGDFDQDSDIDVAIIVPGLTRELKDRILEAVAEVEFEYSRAISTLVFSKNEFDRLYDRERRIALDIRREGIAL